MPAGPSSPNRYPPWNSSIAPAPGDLRIVQAFVNTRDVDAGTDELETPVAAARWLRRWRLIGRRDRITGAERRQAIELREGLRGLLVANNGAGGREGGGAAASKMLDRALGDLPLRCALREAGAFELLAVGGGWPRAAARMLTVVTRAMGDGSWRRLKACRRDGCRWAFYDESKNRSGRWCAMAGCGDLMKARAYRERLRAGSRS